MNYYFYLYKMNYEFPFKNPKFKNMCNKKYEHKKQLLRSSNLQKFNSIENVLMRSNTEIRTDIKIVCLAQMIKSYKRLCLKM